MRVRRRRAGVCLKTPAQIEALREAGRVSAMALHAAGLAIEAGVSTAEVDAEVERCIRAEGAKPAFKGYGGFPAAACVSINEKIVHGIPRADELVRDGDIVSVDTGAVVDGWVGDNAHTFLVGEVDPHVRLLCECCEAARDAGVAAARAGNTLGDIGASVQAHADAHCFGVVRELVGHGVGRALHEPPDVPNFGRAGRGMKLKPGLVIAIEPMFTFGNPAICTLPDGWGIATRDGLPAAHYEHTVAVTDDGPLVLTQL